MPSKKRINAAKRKGTNPYAVCNSQATKSGMSRSKKESCVRKVTNRTLKK